MRYNNLSGYFREKYGKRLKKICIDGGFSCPNRDGTTGYGGCIFCTERGSGEHIDSTLSIKEQVKRTLGSAKKGDEFVAYFQNFTNTYADVEVLRERYLAALSDARIRVLAIGTRPDCIDEERAALIAELSDRVDVWVELGLQTASDEVGRVINRGYDKDVFERAVDILNRYKIPVVVHIIAGLPTDTEEGFKATVDYLAGFRLFGIKLHSIYVSEGTRLAELYRTGEYTPWTREQFVRLAIYTIRRLPRETVFHRLTGDCPRDMLIAPEWNSDKNGILSEIRAGLEALNAAGGDLFD